MEITKNEFYFDRYYNANITAGSPTAIYTKLAKTEIINFLSDMLDIENAPETAPVRFLNFFLLHHGHCILTEYEGNFIFATGSRIPPLDVYGCGTKYRATTKDGKTFERTIGVDCVLFINNNLEINEFDNISRYASMLGNVETSIMLLTKNTRYNPVYKVSNRKIKDVIKEIFKHRDNADSDNNIIESDLMHEINGGKSVEVIDLNDLSQIEKMQYLLNLKENINTVLYNWYGFTKNTSPKMAQQSTAEIRETSGIAMLYPVERLKLLKQSCDQANKLFNLNMVAKFGECWDYETNLDEALQGVKIDTEQEETEQEEREGQNNDN